MSYASATIGSVLNEVNRKFFLPAIQRPYVWNANQVIALFDSLLKGYPISSFMLWAVTPETKRDLRIYRFLEDYHPERQNEPTSPDGRDVVLVLDGQQRLTSLLIGLRGTFAEKSKFARGANPGAWSARSLYIDLFQDPDGEPEEDEASFGVTYGLKFHAVAPRNDHRHHWFKLGRVLDFESIDDLERLIADALSQIHRGAMDLPDFCGERLAHFPDLSLEGDGALEAER